jgi:hypothetical protein
MRLEEIVEKWPVKIPIVKIFNSAKTAYNFIRIILHNLINFSTTELKSDLQMPPKSIRVLRMFYFPKQGSTGNLFLQEMAALGKLLLSLQLFQFQECLPHAAIRKIVITPSPVLPYI